MNISIIIPNHNDLRMGKMIKSIDYYSTKDRTVELLILLNNPTTELENQCKEIEHKYKNKFDIRILRTNIQNLGYLYNFGLTHVKFENVLFLDSDLLCEKGAIENMTQYLNEEVRLVKANLVYKNMNNFVERARFCNTTKDVPPYIPVILIRKDIFNLLKDNFVFAVDVVWCADAEFANRIIKEKIRYFKCSAIFYHDAISIKKDLKDAFLYGFGKSNRIKRTNEKWEPVNEIRAMHKKARNEHLSFSERNYALLWITLQQIACLIQLILPNVFKNKMDFSESLKTTELLNE